MRRPNHTLDQNRGEERAPGRWYHQAWWWSDDDSPSSGSASLLFWHRTKGHGVGFQLGVNGSESDVGLDIYLGKLASVWLRLATPWTKWLRIEGDYYARHIGFRLFPHDHAFASIDIMSKGGYWSSSDPWWMHTTINAHTFFGRQSAEKAVLDTGTCVIPMPEGTYDATWQRQRFVTRYVGRLGILRDRVFGPRRGDVSVWIDVEGGIPCYGKGENSWDCGMDGIFGTGGRSLEDAIGNFVSAATRERNRHGDPKLDRPMTVTEAEARST